MFQEMHRETRKLPGQLGAGEPSGADGGEVPTAPPVPHPPSSSSLAPPLQKCIAMCMDRYMDAWNTVSRAYNSRLQRERANM